MNGAFNGKPHTLSFRLCVGCILALFAFAIPSYAQPAHDLQRICDRPGVEAVSNDCEECADAHDAIKNTAQEIKSWVGDKSISLKKPLICGNQERAQAKARLKSLALQISDISTEITDINQWFEDIKNDPQLNNILEQEFGSSEPIGDAPPELSEEEVAALEKLEEWEQEEQIREYYDRMPAQVAYDIAKDMFGGIKKLVSSFKDDSREAAVGVSEFITDQLQQIKDGATGTGIHESAGTNELSAPDLQQKLDAIRDFTAISLVAKISKNFALLGTLEALKNSLWQEQQDLRKRLLTDVEASELTGLLDRHDEARIALDDCQQQKCQAKLTAGANPSGSLPGERPVVAFPDLPDPSKPIISLPTGEPDPASRPLGSKPNDVGMGTIGADSDNMISDDTVAALAEEARNNASTVATPVFEPSCRGSALGSCNMFPTRQEREVCMRIHEPKIAACEAAGIYKGIRNSCRLMRNYCYETTKSAQLLKPVIIDAREKVSGRLDEEIRNKISVIEEKRTALQAVRDKIHAQRQYFYYNSSSGKIMVHAGTFFEPKPPLIFVGDGPLRLTKKEKAEIEQLQVQINELDQQISALRSQAENSAPWSASNKDKFATFMNNSCFKHSPASTGEFCDTVCNDYLNPSEGATKGRAPEFAAEEALATRLCTGVVPDWELMYPEGDIPQFLYDYKALMKDLR